jgi:hypothetical protein
MRCELLISGNMRYNEKLNLFPGRREKKLLEMHFPIKK